MKIPVKDISGKDSGELDVKFELVEGGRGTQAVHDTVVAHLANRRAGTASTKTMGEVHGSGKKPWRQKGTGRARAGSFASPLWRGGGVVFGPKPRDFGKKVNARTRHLALRKALTERLNAGDVVVVEDIKLDSPKTKGFAEVLKRFELGKGTLLVTPGNDRNLTLAARNIREVQLTTADALNTYEVLRPRKLLFTRSAFEQIEKRLKD